MSWLTRIFAPKSPALPTAPSGPYRAKKKEATVSPAAPQLMSRDEWVNLNVGLQSNNRLAYEGHPLKIEASESTDYRHPSQAAHHDGLLSMTGSRDIDASGLSPGNMTITGCSAGLWVATSGNYIYYDTHTGQYVNPSGSPIPWHLLNSLPPHERQELVSFFSKRFPNDQRIYSVSG